MIRLAAVFACLRPRFPVAAADASSKAGSTSSTGFDMSLLRLDVYQLAADWSLWAAGIIGLAVFVHVHKAAPRFLPTLDQSLAWLRRPEPSEPALAEPMQPVVEPLEPDDDWQREDWLLADWQNDDCQSVDWQRELLEAQMDSLESIEAARDRAGQLIDAAEYMLDRTFEECAAVMRPEAIAQMHRSRAVPAEPPAAELDTRPDTAPTSVAA
jgi:hypothetical protein